MKTTTQSGFAVGIAIAILAVLALAGGGAYVATKNRADVNSNATTTRGAVDFGLRGTTSVDARANVTTATGSGATVDLGINAKVPTTHKVMYTAGGFSPSTLTINKGDTVTFTNQTSGSMLVVSDEHPTHLLLPALNANVTVGLNGTYSFTFPTAGSWTYHNDLDLENTGTIIVK